MTEWAPLWSAIQAASNTLGVVALLCLAVVAFWQEWIVPGTRFRREVKEKDEWKRRSDEATSMARQLVAAMSLDAHWPKLTHRHVPEDLRS